MPTLTGKPSEGESQLPTQQVPTEVALAILYTMASRLEKEALAQVLTGHTPKGEVVTYIRMTGVAIDKEKGFVLAASAPVPTETESVSP